ncbi:MAG: A/G-specific adenine glycosylase [Calditrichaeota bacterium]|nr:MAG: A/G-specific adenine glycosylase [Calditrichota bacterium]
MKKQIWDLDTIKKLQQNLLSWYQQNKRQLLWREKNNPYLIWVAEVMLQQTQVSTAEPYYRRFIQRFPTVERLASAHLDEVLKLWEGLGYYARARNLHKAAKIVLDEYQGNVPDDYHSFKTLPGVGDYIASAVMSISFGQPYAVVDGNVKRVLSRLGTLPFPVNDTRFTKQYQQIADQLLERNHPGEYNQAIMELGALICRPQKPLCEECPVNELCVSFLTNRQTEFPKRKQKAKIPTQKVSVGVVLKEGKVLITRRKENGLLGGLWEFPGGKIKVGETSEDACIREIKEEVDLEVDIISHLKRIYHTYSHFKLIMDVYLCEYKSGDVMLSGATEYRWIHPNEIHKYPFPKANIKFFDVLEDAIPRLNEQS